MDETAGDPRDPAAFQKSPGGRIAQRVENRDRCNPGCSGCGG
jgi:hypothetical protein